MASYSLLSCFFCDKSGEEHELIDMHANALMLESEEVVEFTQVTSEAFGNLNFSKNQPNCICEECKDLIVQFYVIKLYVKNVGKLLKNPTRTMIDKEITSFLSEFPAEEDITVIRSLKCLTIAPRSEPRIFDKISNMKQIIVDNHRESPEPEQPLPVVQEKYKLLPLKKIIKVEDAVDFEKIEEVETETMETEEMCIEYEEYEEYENKEEQISSKEYPTTLLKCNKCEKVLQKKEELEIHQFWHHNSVGLQIIANVDACKGYIETDDGEAQAVWDCQLCEYSITDKYQLRLHMLQMHAPYITTQLNKEKDNTYEIDEAFLNYIVQLEEAEQSGSQEYPKLEESIKEQFYTIYNIEDNSEHEIVSREEMSANDGEMFEFEGKNWVKDEISKSKEVIESEDGPKIVYNCARCNYVSNTAPGFRYHLISKHIKNRDFETEVERKPLDLVTVKYQAIKHRNRKFKDSKNSCGLCCLKFKEVRALNTHESAHELFDVIASSMNYPQCDECRMMFCSYGDLNTHHMRHDTEMASEQIPAIGILHRQGVQLQLPIQSDSLANEAMKWSCGHCTRKFETVEASKHHQLLFHAVTFECPIDKREFSGSKAFSHYNQHLKNKHPEMFPNISFPCTFCRLEFTSIYEKLAHMKVCSEKKYGCDHCNKKFFKKNDLIAHIKFVTGEVVFQCEMCTKACETASDLQIHLRSHTKTKPFKCTLCTKSFRTLAARSAHIESHNPDILYTCNYCMKTFRRRQMYRRHVKALHENTDNPPPKLRVCSLCNKSFSRKYIYVKHMESAHNIVICDEEMEAVGKIE